MAAETEGVPLNRQEYPVEGEAVPTAPPEYLDHAPQDQEYKTSAAPRRRNRNNDSTITKNWWAIVFCVVAVLIVFIVPLPKPFSGKSPVSALNDGSNPNHTPSFPESSAPVQRKDEVHPTTRIPEEASNHNNNNNEKVIAFLNMKRRGPMMDLIRVVDDRSKSRILNEIKDIQKDVSGCEIQVLVVHDIPSDWSTTSKEFTTALFNKWSLGSNSRKGNNGVLIMFLLDARRIEVEVGANLNPHMSPAWTTEMLSQRAVPEFKQGNYGFGIHNVVLSVADRIRDTHASDKNLQKDWMEDGGVFILIGIIFFIVVLVIGCAIWCDHMDATFPLGRNHYCDRCRECQWEHGHWQILHPATYQAAGLKRRHCTCRQCGLEGFKDFEISTLVAEEEEEEEVVTNSSNQRGSPGNKNRDPPGDKSVATGHNTRNSDGRIDSRRGRAYTNRPTVGKGKRSDNRKKPPANRTGLSKSPNRRATSTRAPTRGTQGSTCSTRTVRNDPQDGKGISTGNLEETMDGKRSERSNAAKSEPETRTEESDIRGSSDGGGGFSTGDGGGGASW